MDKKFYVLSPVEVVKVTSQNLEEVAQWCGGRVAKTESRRYPGRMDSYVWVPTPKGTNISWAFPGMFITKRLVMTVNDELKTTWAVFRRDYFQKNYFRDTEEAIAKIWEMEGKHRPKKKEKLVGNVFDDNDAVVVEPTPDEPIPEIEEAVTKTSGFLVTEAAIQENIDKKKLQE